MRRIYFTYITILIISTILLFNAPSYLHSSNCLRSEENTFTSSNPLFEFSTQTHKYETTKKAAIPKLIIILASLGRSGSTMIAELMATKDKSVLFFEPDHRTENSACARVSECMSEYLKNIMLCNYEASFEEWLKSKIFLQYFHPVVKQCNKNRKCERKISIRPLCQDSEYKLTKLIRVRLGFLGSLLKDVTIDLKVVYLVRDPRAAANSIKRLRWESSPNVICPMINDDLLAFDHLESKYPHKLIKIQYEHFSLDPFNQSAILFNFAFGDNILPDAAVNYLELHTKNEDDGPMNTVRDSKRHYQKWRWEIKESTLKSLEGEPFCKKVLEKMKYKLLSNLTTAHNKNISLFIA